MANTPWQQRAADKELRVLRTRMRGIVAAACAHAGTKNPSDWGQSDWRTLAEAIRDVTDLYGLVAHNNKATTDTAETSTVWLEFGATICSAGPSRGNMPPQGAPSIAVEGIGTGEYVRKLLIHWDKERQHTEVVKQDLARVLYQQMTMRLDQLADSTNPEDDQHQARAYVCIFLKRFLALFSNGHVITPFSVFFLKPCGYALNSGLHGYTFQLDAGQVSYLRENLLASPPSGEVAVLKFPSGVCGKIYLTAQPVRGNLKEHQDKYAVANKVLREWEQAVFSHALHGAEGELLEFPVYFGDHAHRLSGGNIDGPDRIMCILLPSVEQQTPTADLDPSDPIAECYAEHVNGLLEDGEFSFLSEMASRRVIALGLSPAGRGLQTDHGIVGTSQAILEIREMIDKVAPHDALSVLITGETGTGKGVVAKAIHEASPRRASKFVSVACTTIQDTLLESELFGHEIGSFTGAVKAKEGLLTSAAGGTVFLDEIGDASPSVQAKLLQVVETGEFRKVGGTTVLKADIRLIAATNRPLKDAMDDGDFRKDLFYRLNTVQIGIPPLRDRQDDVIVLADSFVNSLNEQHGRCKRLASDVKPRLLGYPWPGNVRQLRNAVESAWYFADGDEIEVDDFPGYLADRSGNDAGGSD